MLGLGVLVPWGGPSGRKTSSSSKVSDGSGIGVGDLVRWSCSWSGWIIAPIAAALRSLGSQEKQLFSSLFL